MRALIIVVASSVLLAACQSAPPTPGSTPAGTAVSQPRAPTASPAGPSFGLSPRYGVIAMTRDGFAVRSETDPRPIRRIEPTSHLYLDSLAVSPRSEERRVGKECR